MKLFVPHPVGLLFFNVPLITATTTTETITTIMRDTTTTEAATAPWLRVEEPPAWDRKKNRHTLSTVHTQPS